MLGVLIGQLVSCTAAALPPDDEIPATGGCAASSLLQHGASVNSKRSLSLQAATLVKEPEEEDEEEKEGEYVTLWGRTLSNNSSDPVSGCPDLFGWFHVPKTGSTMERAVLSLTPKLGCAWPYPDFHKEVNERYYDELQGHFLGMFRQPAARSFSSYVYFNFQVFAENASLADSCPDATYPSEVEAYKSATKGLVTKMLAGQQHGGICSLCLASCASSQEPDVETALRRLDGFKFIGLTEHWALSMCLFHRMYDVPCSEDWFENMHPTTYSSFTNLTLKDWEYQDPHDEVLYGKASAIFWSNIILYKISQESCELTCSASQKYD